MSQPIFPDTKKHYEILDGLRGVAALMVVLFHIFEIYAVGDHVKQIVNHGYLAVDFFYMLSGFVIAHAYDDRIMTVGQFFKRRLIRLHPMIVMGMIIGAIAFYFSASEIVFPGLAATPVWKLLVVFIAGCFLIPLPVSWDIRGWTEMFPLNGPAWSLFFEYIGNILYVLLFRRLTTVLLSVLVFGTGAWLAYYTITNPQGDIVGGWSMVDAHQILVGFTRLLYPFLAGLLLSRIFKPFPIKNGFVLCSVLMIVLLSIPRVGGAEHFWMNGLYESIVILFVFPLIVVVGASGSIQNKTLSKICTFLGDISYPVYIVHYPVIYIFAAWVADNKVPVEESWLAGTIVILSSLILAYICFKWYDVPVRKWLTRKFILNDRSQI